MLAAAEVLPRLSLPLLLSTALSCASLSKNPLHSSARFSFPGLSNPSSGVDDNPLGAVKILFNPIGEESDVLDDTRRNGEICTRSELPALDECKDAPGRLRPDCSFCSARY